MASGVTLAPVGAEEVNVYVNGDTKADFTFIASITADRGKLPLILVSKGRTNVCHRQFGHPHFPYSVSHTPTGWCNQDIAVQYLKWLKERMPEGPICLIWDQFSAHKTPLVLDQAREYGIHLISIPKGATGRYQPLDRAVFGALKSKGSSKYNEMFAENFGIKCTKEMAAEILLDSWNELGFSVLERAWNFDAELYEDEIYVDSDADEDDEFVLDFNDENDEEEEI
jgi:hypothetical protein